MRKVLVSIICAFFMISVVFSEESSKLNLSYSFSKGQDFVYRMIVRQSITQTISGQTIVTTQSFATIYKFSVLSVEKNSVYLVKTTIDALAYTMDMFGTQITYDSTNPPDEYDPLSDMFSTVIGSEITFKVASDGTIVEIINPDSLIPSMMKKLKTTDALLREQFEKSLKEQYSGDKMKDSLSFMFIQYPKNAISNGESWNNTIKITSNYPLIFTNTYKLSTATKDAYTLGLKSDITTIPDAPPMEVNSMKFKPQIKGTQEGTIQLNPQTKLIKTYTIQQNLSGQMNIENDSWPISVESTLTCEEFSK